MIWPAMLFNSCVGLLLAGYLLRGVRRFERRADALMAQLDERHATRMARLDQLLADDLRKYDLARDEIRASMRAQVDMAIAEMEVRDGGRPTAQITERHVIDALSLTQAAEVRSTGTPTEDEIRELPRWVRVAFAARCARRVLPLFRHNWRGVPQEYFVQANLATEVSERSASLAGEGAEVNSLGAVTLAAYVCDAIIAAARDHVRAVEVIKATQDAIAKLKDIERDLASIVAVVAHNSSVAVANGVATSKEDYTAAESLANALIRYDFETIRALAGTNAWNDATPVPPSAFGPLWPECVPLNWPKTGEARD